MIVINGLLVGTVSLALARVYERRQKRNLMYWLSALDHNVFEPNPENTEQLNTMYEQTQLNYQIATNSLALGLLGSLLYPPLTLASIPLNLYASYFLFEQTLDNILNRTTIYRDLFGSGATILFFVTGSHLSASVLLWLLALDDKMTFALSMRLQHYFDSEQMRFDWWRFMEDLRQESQRFSGEFIALGPGQFKWSDAAPQPTS